jgi:hypothetical protein
MKSYLIILLFFFSSTLFGNEPSESKSNEIGTFSVSGKIIENSSGESLTGVEIVVLGANISVFSDFDGEFEIEGLKPGVDYAIRISYVSYKKKIIRGINSGDDTIIIKLENNTIPANNSLTQRNPFS